jgi:sulfur carrier protein ThiS
MVDTNTYILINRKKIKCRSNTPLWKVMKENQISISAHLAVRSGELITDDEMVNSGDLIELIPVVSGG